jgi:threonine dehydrogenase-like Zn-dependent dehydrogenase
MRLKRWAVTACEADATSDRSIHPRSIIIHLITHCFNMSEILQACETFASAADTKALKVIIEA